MAFGQMPGHYMTREPGLGSQRECRLGERPLTCRPNSSTQPIFRSKISRDGTVSSSTADFLTAAPSSKNMKLNEIELQTVVASETC